MVYIVIIASLVIAWAETWMLDFKVLPRERKAAATGSYCVKHVQLLNSNKPGQKVKVTEIVCVYDRSLSEINIPSTNACLDANKRPQLRT